LIRGGDGRLRCFAHCCRHRGSLLPEGKGNAGGRVTCPYHARSCLTDGRLFGCPDMKDAEDFDKAEYGLVALDLDSWEGVVFARFARQGQRCGSIWGISPTGWLATGWERCGAPGRSR
jgi:phenylpropionate dioxygenase-like ring-hydroxylating dioxygenase large terminal subunit